MIHARTFDADGRGKDNHFDPRNPRRAHTRHVSFRAGRNLGRRREAAVDADERGLARIRRSLFICKTNRRRAPWKKTGHVCHPEPRARNLHLGTGACLRRCDGFARASAAGCKWRGAAAVAPMDAQKRRRSRQGGPESKRNTSKAKPIRRQWRRRERANTKPGIAGQWDLPSNTSC